MGSIFRTDDFEYITPSAVNRVTQEAVQDTLESLQWLDEQFLSEVPAGA